ncbi:protein FAM161A-like [Sardina pilchardus]|uniref:protein FAM161A-like n=1 Tax=Sardina pilchardus TaxID=27697 RepID=UPI002E0E04D9
MSAMVQQTPKLRASEVWALYGGELEYCLGGEDGEEQEAEYFDRHSERSDGQASVGEHHSPSAPAEYELVSQHSQGLASLSDQDYYSQLEALKRVHLQNIAELEVLYLNELTASKAKASQATQVEDKDEINKSAQDESEPLPAGPETSAISKQDLELEQKSVSETDTPGSQGTDGEQKKREEEEDEETAESASKQSSADAANEAQSSKPQAQPEPMVVVSKATRAASKDRSRAPSRRSSWTERSGRRVSRPVTVPKPFQMMVREDDKKRRNVKTRSEVVLENTLLRRELEEMRECRRQFRAAPAPQRTRSLGRLGRTTSLDRASDSSGCSGGSRSRNASPQPFSFIERERKKRERKLEEALLGGVGPRDQRFVFKARPLPRIYRACTEDCQLFGAVEMHSRDQEQQQQQQQQYRGPPASRGLQRHARRVQEREGMEVDVDTKKSKEKPEGREDQDESVDGPERPILDNANWTLRRKPSLAGKALLLEGERGRGVRRGREMEWSYIQPIQRTCISLNLASSFSVKSDYISV